MVRGCVDVCTADDGMLMEVRDEHRRDRTFELVSGSNAWAPVLGVVVLSVYCMHFCSNRRGSERKLSLQLLYVGEFHTSHDTLKINDCFSCMCFKCLCVCACAYRCRLFCCSVASAAAQTHAEESG